MLDATIQDLRYGWRHLRRSPGFAVAALLTLALGIGANSAMFSLLNALVLRPLPIEDPQGLIAISGRNARQQLRPTPIPAIDLLKRDGSPLSRVCGYNAGEGVSVEIDGAAAQVVGGLVTGDCFDTFGVPPLHGRTIGDADAPLQAAGNLVAVISHRMWTRLLGADPSVLGKPVRVEGVDLRIIGIMPAGFGGLHADSGIDLFAPFDTFSPARRDRRPAASYIVGRLRPGVDFEQAARQLDAQWPAVLEYAVPAAVPPAERQSLVTARPRLERVATGFSLLRDSYARPVTMMFGLTAILLALACLNLGGLLLSRAIERAPEMTLRLALGGSRWRIARQVLIENLLLSLAGAALAVPVAFAIVAGVVSYLPARPVARTMTFSPDAIVLAATALMSVAAGCVMSVLPIWIAAPRRNVIAIGGSRAVARAGGRWSRGLLVVQVALSVVMVVGAGLLGRSLYLLQHVDSGLRSDGVMVARVRPLPSAYRGLDRGAYYPPLLDRVASIPGVTNAGFGRIFPRMIQEFPGEAIAVVGEPEADLRAHLEVVSPTFFETVGIPLLRGRATAWSDHDRSRHVAVVSERLARMLDPKGDVVGRRVRFGIDPVNQDVEIVGVVGNATMGNPRRTDLPMFFRPVLQLPGISSPTLVIRHEPHAAATLATALRTVVAAAGREYLLDVASLDDTLARAPASERMSATLALPLAALAIGLAFTGVFGLLAYSVTGRRREIGVRAAIGADPGSVVWMVMREGVTLTIAGVVLGLPAAYGGGRLLDGLTFGLARADPLTFGSAALFFILLGAAAGLVPARRAAGVDPAIALRAE